MSYYEARHFTGADVDDDYEDRDDLLYQCPKCYRNWGTMGWLPPDYPDWSGLFAAVVCIDIAADAFCEWCEVEGRPVL